jgi:hypothetical protein
MSRRDDLTELYKTCSVSDIAEKILNKNNDVLSSKEVV